MRQTTPANQPGSAGQARTGPIRRILYHKATLPILAGSLVMVLGILVLAFLPGNQLSTTWGQGAFWGMGVLAAVVVCGVAYQQDKSRESQLLTSTDSTQLRQQLYREHLEDLPPDFVDLRERLCQGIGGREARKWHSKIDSAIFPGADLKDVVDRWLRKVFTVADGPLHRALMAGGSFLQAQPLRPADIGIPLPGERRSPHMTPAWYADQIARAAKKTGTPVWRSYLNIPVALVTVGALIYLEFVANASLLTLAISTIAGVLFMVTTLMWSIGVNPGGGYAWRSMAHYLIVELHVSAPHAPQPDCLDTDCPNNTDTSMA